MNVKDERDVPATSPTRSSMELPMNKEFPDYTDNGAIRFIA